MDNNFLISIGTIWLTDDGTETGEPCLIQISGIAALLQADAANTTVSNNGEPFRESPLNPTYGRGIEIKVLYCPVSVYEDLKDFLDTNAADKTKFDFSISGIPGAATGAAIVWDSPTYFDFGEFDSDTIYDLIIRIITAEPES